MDRRKYIVSACALVGLAGCSGSDPTDTATGSPTDSTTATPSATATEEPTETATEAPTETETETETPEPGAEARSYVDEAETAVEDVVELINEYADTPNTSFAESVTAATTNFDAGEVSEGVSTANSAISEAREYETTDEQERRLSRLETATNWLTWYHRTTSQLIACYKLSQNALGRYLTEYDVDAARSILGDIEIELGPTNSNYDAFVEAESEFGSSTAVSNLSMDDVQSTMDRIDAELAIIELFPQEMRRIFDGESTYGEANEHYAAGEYSASRSDFESARDLLDESESAFDEAPSTSAFADGTSRLSCLTTHLSDAADAAQLAAYHAHRGNSSEREEYESENEAAIDALGDCDLDMSERPDYY